VASDTVQMTMVPTPVVDLGNDTVICEQFPHRIGAEVAGATYSWNTGASDPYITVASSGSYILEVDVQACAVRDTIVITADPIPDINLGRDRYICQGQVISLDGSHGDGRQYLWSTGDTTAYFQASSPGTYSVVVTTHRGCVGKDTVVLTALPLPEIHLGTDTTVCEETPLVLRPFTMNAESLLWSDGSVGSLLEVSHGGTYTVSATNECGTVTDTIHIRQIFCDIWVPNVFTPNGDGKNDVFRVLGNVGRTEYFSLSIFDRWGQRVFYTSDKYQGWDGVYNGTPCMVGTFVYLLEYHIEGKPFIDKGNFHLLR
jgi:gliding motility-associated-like protein